jgi:hypothetical protein
MPIMGERCQIEIGEHWGGILGWVTDLCLQILLPDGTCPRHKPKHA